MFKHTHDALVCAVLCWLAPCAFPQNVDPKPVQVTADFVFPPSPILQVGTQHLVYELRLTMMDGLPENVPHSGKLAIDLTWQNAGGNHVVVDIGYGLYAFYAHLHPGSLTVKEGDIVTAGQILGHVGNTGSSTEPHLPFHIVDRANFLSGQGVPYEFTNFSTSPRIDIQPIPNSDVVTFTTFGPIQSVQNDYPQRTPRWCFREESLQAGRVCPVVS
jgi:peptidase M23-like protein